MNDAPQIQCDSVYGSIDEMIIMYVCVITDIVSERVVVLLAWHCRVEATCFLNISSDARCTFCVAELGYKCLPYPVYHDT